MLGEKNSLLRLASAGLLYKAQRLPPHSPADPHLGIDVAALHQPGSNLKSSSALLGRPLGWAELNVQVYSRRKRLRKAEMKPSNISDQDKGRNQLIFKPQELLGSLSILAWNHPHQLNKIILLPLRNVLIDTAASLPGRQELFLRVQ